MSKDQSQLVKGIAILMMLYYHLYIGTSDYHMYIAQACHPVPFFLVVSGYGFTCQVVQQRYTTSHVLKRSLNLYLSYWLTLAVFVTIGHFIKPAVYPGGITPLLTNIIGIDCTYNGEVWFLFPYVLVCLAAKKLVN